MRKSEIVDLISMARAFDDRIEEVTDPYENADGRIVEDARITAWHLILGDIDYELASRGLAELYQEPQMMRLQPGHIFQAAERVRGRNVAAADLDQLRPPDELAVSSEPGERSRAPEWKQAAIRAIGRGCSVEEAQTIADDELRVSRRMLGPAVRRDPLELIQGETA
ncbi:MAG: hypothetical protein L0G94_10515 [Brachybacterium sp.]|uniref:hypothetical protein n=1 Tax=Brachybacterium sp. TaxID=1891286 RepID=UPI00264923B2|nr:hypothetical protein [Brachybacterium sp.]MDN5687088.1 hypothetical protein [Brachybacterium sp.]